MATVGTPSAPPVPDSAAPAAAGSAAPAAAGSAAPAAAGSAAPAAAGSAAPAAAGSAAPAAAGSAAPAAAGSAAPGAPNIRTRQRWSARWRSGFGVPRNELNEVYQLGNHILERLHQERPRGLSDDSLRDWVTSRFISLLRALLVRASSNTRGYLVLNLVVIGGGFATSGIAVAAGTGHKSSTAAWIVFGVGLAVALAGGISQVFRPGYRATQRTTLAMELQEEGWAFVLKTRDYPGEDPAVDFERLNQRVSDIHRRAAQVIGLEPESRTGQAAAATGRTPSNRGSRSK